MCAMFYSTYYTIRHRNTLDMLNQLGEAWFLAHVWETLTRKEQMEMAHFCAAEDASATRMLRDLRDRVPDPDYYSLGVTMTPYTYHILVEGYHQGLSPFQNSAYTLKRACEAEDMYMVQLLCQTGADPSMVGHQSGSQLNDLIRDQRNRHAILTLWHLPLVSDIYRLLFEMLII